MAGTAKVFQLKCSWQSNNWGKKGSESEVARLLKSSDPSFEIDDTARYAELWMGTHVKWPSQIHGSTELLGDWLRDHPDTIGDDVTSVFGHELPFLLKVLSIDLPLSLQAHPGKELATRLYAQDPIHYLDSNHKPELCIALTPFRGLCGFRPLEEIAAFLSDIEELVNVVGRNNAEMLIQATEVSDSRQQERALKSCFSALLWQEKDVIMRELRKLVDRVKQLDVGDTRELEGDVLLQLYREYPDDVGCFSVYFLNVISLEPGEAIFLETEVLHAYLEGDCVECLACSDNILRAGLTAKYKDIDTLIDVLKYEGKPGEAYKLQPFIAESREVKTFYPPVNDFAVSQIQVSGIGLSNTLQAIPSASIVICIRGQGTISNNSVETTINIQPGIVLFVSANEECKLNTNSDMLLYRAFVGKSYSTHLKHFIQ